MRASRLVGADAAGAQVVLSELRSGVAALIVTVRHIGDNPRGVAHQVRDMESALCYLIRQANRVVAPRLKLSLSFDPHASSAPEEIRSAAFCIVLGAVTNVLRHSTARHCAVALSLRDNELYVSVSDDGRVVEPSSVGGSGLANMAARAAEVGGWFSAGAQEPTGFLVAARFPLPPQRG